MKELRIKFTPIKSDYLHGFRAYYWQKRWLLTIAMIMAGFFGTGLIALVGLALGRQMLHPFFIIYCLVCPLLLFILFGYPFALLRQVDKTPHLTKETSYSFNRDGTITYKTIYSEHIFEVNHFNEVVVGKEQLVLVHRKDKRVFQVIPRNAFINASQEMGLREWLLKNITDLKIN